MDHKVPSYRTFGYFINEILRDSIEKLFCDINQKIFEKEHTDLQHLYTELYPRVLKLKINFLKQGSDLLKQAVSGFFSRFLPYPGILVCVGFKLRTVNI